MPLTENGRSIFFALLGLTKSGIDPSFAGHFTLDIGIPASL